MLKGYSQPRTATGQSSLVCAPPWHFAGNVIAIEYETHPQTASWFLPEPLTLASNKCCVYFIDWQFTSEHGNEHLAPASSQYKETLFLVPVFYQNTPMSFCPFIWVDQDTSLLRGLIQGWPKQFGETWMTRSFSVLSKASAVEEPGTKFGAMLSVRGRCMAEAQLTLQEETPHLPTPTFSNVVNARWFPDLSASSHEKPIINDLVQLKTRNTSVSTIWKGNAQLEICNESISELGILKPTKTIAGYRFSVALTIDGLTVLTKNNR